MGFKKSLSLWEYSDSIAKINIANRKLSSIDTKLPICTDAVLGGEASSMYVIPSTYSGTAPKP